MSLRACSARASSCALLSMVLCAYMSGCSMPQAMQPKQAGPSMKEYHVHDQAVRIDEAELERIRSCVLRALAPYDDERKALREELQRSIAIVGPDEVRLGAWVLTERDGSLVLVWHSPRAAINHAFVAILDRRDGEWHVVELREERMLAR